MTRFCRKHKTQGYGVNDCNCEGYCRDDLLRDSVMHEMNIPPDTYVVGSIMTDEQLRAQYQPIRCPFCGANNCRRHLKVIE